MTSTIQNIRQHARRARAGTPLIAKGLLHFGSRAAVDQALSRLSRSGELERVGRGLYVRPIPTRFGRRLPQADRFLELLAKQTGETITPSEAIVANRLGLTTQVPIRQVYLTNGRSRLLRLGSLTVELKHAPAKQLVRPKSKAGDLVRALQWADSEEATNQVLEYGNRELSSKEKREFLALRSQLSTQQAESASKLAIHA